MSLQDQVKLQLGDQMNVSERLAFGPSYQALANPVNAHPNSAGKRTSLALSFVLRTCPPEFPSVPLMAIDLSWAYIESSQTVPQQVRQ